MFALAETVVMSVAVLLIRLLFFCAGFIFRQVSLKRKIQCENKKTQITKISPKHGKLVVPMGTGFVLDLKMQLDLVALWLPFQVSARPDASIYSLSLPNSNCPEQTFDTTVYKENTHSLTARLLNMLHRWSEKDKLTHREARVAQSASTVRIEVEKCIFKLHILATDNENSRIVCTRRKYAAKSKYRRNGIQHLDSERTELTFVHVLV